MFQPPLLSAIVDQRIFDVRTYKAALLSPADTSVYEYRFHGRLGYALQVKVAGKDDTPIHQEQVKAVMHSFHGVNDLVQAPWGGLWGTDNPKTAEIVERKLQETGALVEWKLDAEISEAVPVILSQRLADTDQERIYWAFSVDGVSHIVTAQRSEMLTCNLIWCASYSADYQKTIPPWFRAMFPDADGSTSLQPQSSGKDVPDIQLDKNETDRLIAAIISLPNMKLRKFVITWKFAIDT